MADEIVSTRNRKCLDCGFLARNKAHVEMHVKNHHAKMKILCRLCKFKSSSHLSYNSHVNNRHRDIPWSDHTILYKCDLCTFTTNSIDKVDRHHLTDHGIQKEFACAKCNFNFKSRRHLRRHWTRECYSTSPTPAANLLALSYPKTETVDDLDVKTEVLDDSELKAEPESSVICKSLIEEILLKIK